MEIIADLHSHNGEICGHAQTTVAGLIAAAQKRGLSALALTDHAPRCDNTPFEYYTNNLSRPKFYDGLRLYCGIEADILDENAAFDLPQKDMLRLEWVIASLHSYAFEQKDAATHTRAYIAALHNPAVDCLGHIGRDWFDADYEAIIPEVKRCGKTLEINNHSFDFSAGKNERCQRVAKLCMEQGVGVVVTSDSHDNSTVGNFANAIAMLEEIGFPEELVINADKDRFEKFLARRTAEKLAAAAAL